MGYYRFIVHPGSLIFAVCLLLLSFVGEEEFAKVFVLQAIGMGLAMGLVFMPTTVIPIHFFKRRRGLAIGIVLSGGSLGGAVFPPRMSSFLPSLVPSFFSPFFSPLTAHHPLLIPRVALLTSLFTPLVLRALIHTRGFAPAVRVTACIAFALLLIGNGLLRTPPREEKPLFPVPFLDLTKYSGELGYVGAGIATFLAVLFIYWPAMYLDLLGLEHGVNPNLAFYTIIIVSFTSVIARVGFGLASDFIGPWNTMIPVSFFLAIMMFTTCTMWVVSSLEENSDFLTLRIELITVKDRSRWLRLSLIITAIASLATRKSELGTRIGLIFTLGSIAFLLSALVHDAVLTAQHVWAIPSAVSGVVFLAVAILMGGARMMTLAGKEEKTRKRLGVLKGVPVLEELVVV
ncbi:hypothetical protein CVT26_006481 [Gymnopilus dilepis]|uniref:Major facilitator superfamily (MFS) profile domain-containing protein n=1 Tax=Gymnopilus dilepis TaxID=231916 RepID=A0A409W6H3_9AGAR|nr:hypothetical protein CVT26_006481 [Gymnopilus dilepis]